MSASLQVWNSLKVLEASYRVIFPWQGISFANTTYKYSKTNQLHGTWKSLKIIINTLIYIFIKWHPINVVFTKSK